MLKIAKRWTRYFVCSKIIRQNSITKNPFLFLGAYTTHQMVVRMALTSYDQIPDKLAEFCYVEYTMPQTVVSHTTIRSVSVQDSDSDDPPEKYVRYLSRYEYQYVSCSIPKNISCILLKFFNFICFHCDFL